MNRLILRRDLEGWPCAKCQAVVFEVCFVNCQSYCDPCEQTVEEIEIEEVEEEGSEVNFTEETTDV